MTNYFKLFLLAIFAAQPFYTAVWAKTPAPAVAVNKTQAATLAGLTARVRIEAAQNTVPTVIFDLDDTTFDSRYKRLMIIRDFISQPAVASAYPAETAKIKPALDKLETVKTSMKETMYALGVSNPDFISEAGKFSNGRIMSEWYLSRETAVAGAPAYINGLYNAGARIVYISARGTAMRSGTENALRANNLLLGKPRVALYLNERDEEVVGYKARVLNEVRKSGKVIGGFENEPENINMFKNMFPDGFMFFLNTRKSSNTPLSPGITVINNYLRAR